MATQPPIPMRGERDPFQNERGPSDFKMEDAHSSVEMGAPEEVWRTTLTRSNG